MQEMVGCSKLKLRSFAISSMQPRVDCEPTFAQVSECISWCFTLHTSTFASTATWSGPSLLQSFGCKTCRGIAFRSQGHL